MVPGDGFEGGLDETLLLQLLVTVYFQQETDTSTGDCQLHRFMLSRTATTVLFFDQIRESIYN